MLEVMDVAKLQVEVEAVSVFYAEGHGIDRTDDWLMLKLGEEVGELTQAYLARSGRARDKERTQWQREEDFRAELVDVLAQVLLIAQRFDVDLVSEVERKWLRWTRAQSSPDREPVLSKREALKCQGVPNVGKGRTWSAATAAESSVVADPGGPRRDGQELGDGVRVP